MWPRSRRHLHRSRRFPGVRRARKRQRRNRPRHNHPRHNPPRHKRQRLNRQRLKRQRKGLNELPRSRLSSGHRRCSSGSSAHRLRRALSERRRRRLPPPSSGHRRPRSLSERRHRRRRVRSMQPRLTCWSSRASSLWPQVTSSPPGWSSSALPKPAMRPLPWRWALPTIQSCCRGWACAVLTLTWARHAPGTRRPRTLALPTPTGV